LAALKAGYQPWQIIMLSTVLTNSRNTANSSWSNSARDRSIFGRS